MEHISDALLGWTSAVRARKFGFYFCAAERPPPSSIKINCIGGEEMESSTRAFFSNYYLCPISLEKFLDRL